MDTEDAHTMKISTMRLTILTIVLKEEVNKMGNLRKKNIEQHSQGMNGTYSLPVNLCFGEWCRFCQKTSMSNGI